MLTSTRTHARGRLSLRGDGVILAVLTPPVLIAASTLEAGQWVEGLPSLKAIASMGLILGFLLGRRDLRAWPSLLVATVTGAAVAGGLGFVAIQEGPEVALIGTGLMALSWWVGYGTGWLSHQPSLALASVFPGLLIVSIFLALLPEGQSWMLILYLVVSAPALACVYAWGQPSNGKRPPWLALSAGSLGLAAMVVPAAYLVPSPGKSVPFMVAPALEETAYSLWEFASKPLTAVPNRRAPQFGLPDELPFTAPLHLTDDVLMTVESSVAYKWRIRVYETYTSGGWVRDSQAPEVAPLHADLPGWQRGLKARRPVKAAFRLHSSSQFLSSVGVPMEASVPALVEMSPRSAISVVSWPLPMSLDAAQPIPPAKEFPPVSDFTPTQTVTRPDARLGPPLAMVKPTEKLLRPLLQYTTVGSVSRASPERLRSAGRGYPRWVTDRYLQLPEDFPRSVEELAQRIVRGERNAYDRAIAIELYLSALPYSQQILPPPPGRDGVEYFLFEQRVGYCQYFSSAMITMLRSLGIPARHVTGFAPGEWNSARGVWEVQARHYHAWPEVYFPGYGWIEFEPTPIGVQPALESLGVETFDPCLESPEACAALNDAEEHSRDQFQGEGTEISPDRGSFFILGLFESVQAATGAIMGLTGLLAVAGTVYINRKLNRLGMAAATYASMRFLGGLAGVPHRPYDTPAEYGARLAASLPHHDNEVVQISHLYNVSRYAPRSETAPADIERVRIGWKRLRLGLLKATLRRLAGGRLRTGTD